MSGRGGSDSDEESSGPSAHTVYALAEDALESGDVATAAYLFTVALEELPQLPEADELRIQSQLRLAHCFLHSHHAHTSLSLCEEALATPEICDRFPQLYTQLVFCRCQAFHKLGRLQLAAQCLVEARQRDPTNADFEREEVELRRSLLQTERPPQDLAQNNEQRTHACYRLMLSGHFGVRRASGSVTGLLERRRMAGAFSAWERSAMMERFLPNTRRRQVDRYPARAYGGQFSRDGTLFYASCQDWQVHVYSFDGEAVGNHRVVECNPGGWTITDCVMASDNRFFLYSSISPRVYMCLTEGDGEWRNEHRCLDLSSDIEETFAIWALRLPEGNHEVVAGGSDHRVRLFNMERGHLVLCLLAHEDDVNSVAFADEASNIVLSGSDDSLIKVWDRRSISGRGIACGVLCGHTEGITHVSPKGDGRYIISNSKDQTLKLWDLRMMRPMSEYSRLRIPVPQFHWDYRWEPYPGIPSDVRHPHDGSTLTFQGHRVLKTLIRCYFSPLETTGQRYVYTGSENGRVHIFSLQTGRTVQVLSANSTSRHRAVIRDVAWHPFMPTLFTTSWDGRVQQFDHRQEEDRGSTAS